MAAAAEVQALLRFLTKEAHLALAEALPKINDLRKLNLNDPDSIAKAQEADLKIIFADEKVLKQVSNAAKRVSNPRRRTVAQPGNITSKRTKHDEVVDDEEDLVLPVNQQTIAELETFSIETNRAPLLLAFTLVNLNYTHPEQPLSSRLSLAQAVVSAGAQSKAKYIGISTGRTAEEDGWAQGQPKLKIMGRQVAVMRRQVALPFSNTSEDEEATQRDESSLVSHDLFWGLDLEALRKSNGPLIAGKNARGQSGPPIHRAQAARGYLLRSMNIVEVNSKDLVPTSPQGSSEKPKKLSATEIAAKKEKAAGMVLKAIDIVCKSWVNTLTTDELDRRAQSWYMTVRPEVAQGKSGWGQRGIVQLRDILNLRRED